MGADGGTICDSRDIIVTLKQAPQRDSKTFAREHRWNTCAISKERLQEPIVADRLGNLMNKDSVIKKLLEKDRTKGFRHIRKLKDVFPVHFTANPDFSERELEDKGLSGYTVPRFICPMTLQEVKGNYRFVVPVACGHVISEKCLGRLGITECPVCSKPFADTQLVELLPDEEKEIDLRLQLEEEFEMEEKTRREKKLERRAARAAAKQPAVTATSSSSSSSSSSTSAVTAVGQSSLQSTTSKERSRSHSERSSSGVHSGEKEREGAKEKEKDSRRRKREEVRHHKRRKTNESKTLAASVAKDIARRALSESARYLHAQPDSIKSMFTNDKRERELQKGEKFALRGAAPTHC